MIVGIDEAGRGPLAGSVVSCALYIKESIDLPVRDSKSMSHARRQEALEYFKDKTIFSVGIATHEEIDNLNILNATYLSFTRAIQSIIEQAPFLKKAKFIIDGNRFKSNLDINHECIVKADTKVQEVALASIVAKVFRDHLMEIADFVFPEWNFIKHKGYPTKEHYERIKEHSLSPMHRKSFCRSL